MTAPTEAAVSSFVAGCVARGITASVAVAPSPGQFETVSGLWADVAREVIAAYVEANGGDPVDPVHVIAEVVAPELAAVTSERDQLREALQWLAGDGNLEARDRLAAITRAGET